MHFWLIERNFINLTNLSKFLKLNDMFSAILDS